MSGAKEKLLHSIILLLLVSQISQYLYITYRVVGVDDYSENKHIASQSGSKTNASVSLQLQNHSNSFVTKLIAQFSSVEWTEPNTSSKARDGRWDLRQFYGAYDDKWINISTAMCDLMHSLTNRSITFIGDSLTRQTFEAAFLADLRQAHQNYPCRDAGFISNIRVQCQQVRYASNASDNFVTYRVVEKHEKCLQRWKQKFQICGGINKGINDRASARLRAGAAGNATATAAVHIRDEYHCDCVGGPRCRVTYDHKDATYAFDANLVKSYRIYPEVPQYSMDGTLETWTQSMGPTLFRDLVRDSDITLTNFGLHYGQIMPEKYYEMLTFIADVLWEDQRLQGNKTHIWRLSFPQHFRNSNHPHIHYGFHGFFNASDLDSNEEENLNPMCLRFGEEAERHWSDVLATPVFQRYNISMLDYYEVMKVRGDVHRGGGEKDCSHVREPSRTFEIWRPFWFLLNELVKQ